MAGLSVSHDLAGQRGFRELRCATVADGVKQVDLWIAHRRNRVVFLVQASRIAGLDIDGCCLSFCLVSFFRASAKVFVSFSISIVQQSCFRKPQDAPLEPAGTRDTRRRFNDHQQQQSFRCCLEARYIRPDFGCGPGSQTHGPCGILMVLGCRCEDTRRRNGNHGAPRSARFLLTVAVPNSAANSPPRPSGGRNSAAGNLSCISSRQ